MTYHLTLKDVQTGQEVRITTKGDGAWFSQGNGSCDCNRAPEFEGLDEAMEAEMRARHPDLSPWAGLCYGAFRVVIIKSDIPGYTLQDLNHDYPAKVLRLAGILTDLP